MHRQFLRDESGVSRIEYSLYLACFCAWCFIVLEGLGIVQI